MGTTIDRILSEKLIAVIRLEEQEAVAPTVNALVTGGVQVLEITTNTPGFAKEIKNARDRHPQVSIGAGTVTNAELATQAIAAGAQFLVTPNTNRTVAEVSNSSGVPVVMGAVTPTEVADALTYGADIIKLFPAGNLGISYFKSLKGPFDAVPFFVVGGIDENNIRDWFAAGIGGVGLGSSLVKSGVKTEADFKEITALAEKFLSFRSL
ncbi:bifunctional 4-hydroxy-2-oxoglutarate aldolase/2-dehydro-3-deoxy-phosphogluconate aldolase [Pricia sp. S334]|uniref:Bifunctional 4-hydroxy-2-oxoglutarate aldolase/2-dehydro-3-deoxy-phosphogluconate aldolase n=1 Tax=Pricia mediterranea TaxID=3076079 RepID=A0ABU3L1M5_9FLAO|nr:bifunctional 4-hydroxy-2-oxoglutarate aldolase/2-dehydro-3-deoxy-phosphogluconate aldolase [Pricia sp. S334]MDT7827621.1 bifunctional 4-hydroxy-2-oxoglutarate aldolase/2-dehydro-3-deoxy-phosphogluconate aldolase [Pricia sp. S334]